jgi:CheY-like chemotaxis protein
MMVTEIPTEVRTRRILVVDDFTPVAELLAKSLRRKRYRAVFVNNAPDALARLDDVRFDLVICDILMPGIDGWDLMRQIRARHGIPGIAISALHAPEHKLESLRSGYSMHLDKPVDLDTLTSAIDKVLLQSRGHA